MTRRSLTNASDWEVRTIGYLALAGAVIVIGILIAFVHLDADAPAACTSRRILRTGRSCRGISRHRQSMSEALSNLAGAEWFQARGVQAIFALIAGGGEEARVVGGAVRNALLGVPVRDVDLPRPRRPTKSLRSPVLPASRQCRPASTTAR